MAYRFENLKLDKVMYRHAGQTFTQVLEALDPSQQYKGTEMEGLDAFQRQLKRFDIKVKGPGSDCVEKFFRTADSAVLFPEYVSRCVRQGMEQNDVLSQVTAAVTHTEGMDYRSVMVAPNGDGMEAVSEGGEMPVTAISLQANLIKLKKRGRMLMGTYEAIRFQKLDVFSITLRQIGASIGRSFLEDAVDVLINGDGNDNAAEVMNVATSGTLTYDDLVKFWAKFAPYQMNTLLVSDDVMLQLLKLPEFQNPLVGMNFQGTGKLVTPMGATLLRCSALPTGAIIGLDKNYALEMVEGGGVVVEHDKLIDRQLEYATVSAISGFAKVFKDAARVLKV